MSLKNHIKSVLSSVLSHTVISWFSCHGPGILRVFLWDLINCDFTADGLIALKLYQINHDCGLIHINALILPALVYICVLLIFPRMPKYRRSSKNTAQGMGGGGVWNVTAAMDGGFTVHLSSSDYMFHLHNLTKRLYTDFIHTLIVFFLATGVSMMPSKIIQTCTPFS